MCAIPRPRSTQSEQQKKKYKIKYWTRKTWLNNKHVQRYFLPHLYINFFSMSHRNQYATKQSVNSVSRSLSLSPSLSIACACVQCIMFVLLVTLIFCILFARLTIICTFPRFYYANKFSAFVTVVSGARCGLIEKNRFTMDYKSVKYTNAKRARLSYILTENTQFICI